jgi:hypothetical protein
VKMKKSYSYAIMPDGSHEPTSEEWLLPDEEGNAICTDCRVEQEKNAMHDCLGATHETNDANTAPPESVQWVCADCFLNRLDTFFANRELTPFELKLKAFKEKTPDEEREKMSNLEVWIRMGIDDDDILELARDRHSGTTRRTVEWYYKPLKESIENKRRELGLQ